MGKTNFIQIAIEGIILSLLNLALLALVNEHEHWGFRVLVHGFPSRGIWYLLLFIFSFVVALLTVKLKKIETNKSKWIVGIYSFTPLIVDLCFRDRYGLDYENLIWMFLIVSVVWALIRYEINEIIK